ncbi:MAG: flagellar basal body rod protein FlgB [Acetobacteraceae bacterium]|nr:flagellar basal body rod protein FlgB [Acetobacteraceae bacterium]
MAGGVRVLGEDATLYALERGLEAASLRHRALAHNVANADTPGYKRQDVTFASRLARLLGTGGAGGRGASGRELEPRVVVDSSTTGRADGNNVEVEVEMALMAENSLWYQSMVRLVSEKLGRLKLAITEGRR